MTTDQGDNWIVEELRSRIEHGSLSLREVEQLCGVSASTLSRLLQGKEMSGPTRRSLQAWLKGVPALVGKKIHSKIVVLNKQRFRLTLEEL